MNTAISNVLVSNTGSPKGCILLFFILYMDSCRSSKKGSYLVKFSNDTALLSLFQALESAHGSDLPAFIDCCDHNFLDLSVSKTKELSIDFTKNKDKPKASTVHDEDVEIVDSLHLNV